MQAYSEKYSSFYNCDCAWRVTPSPTEDYVYIWSNFGNSTYYVCILVAI